MWLTKTGADHICVDDLIATMPNMDLLSKVFGVPNDATLPLLVQRMCSRTKVSWHIGVETFWIYEL